MGNHYEITHQFDAWPSRGLQSGSFLLLPEDSIARQVQRPAQKRSLLCLFFHIGSNWPSPCLLSIELWSEQRKGVPRSCSQPSPDLRTRESPSPSRLLSGQRVSCGIVRSQTLSEKHYLTFFLNSWTRRKSEVIFLEGQCRTTARFSVLGVRCPFSALTPAS